jgi:hypothetical protein
MRIYPFLLSWDDDLLEKVLSHVSKTIAGFASARLWTDNQSEDTLAVMDAMVSKDAEVVPFVSILH